MTQEELQKTFQQFNSQYFDGKLTCELRVTEDWTDADGDYYPDSAVGGDDLFEGTCGGIKVRRASALYTHSRNLISIPKWKMAGENATRSLLLHEMAHAAANEPDVDHGPKWYEEMHRLWKLKAPINMHDVTPGCSEYPLVHQYGVGSEFWNKL